MPHETTLPRYSGTLSELADDIGNLRYDALVALLQNLSTRMESNSNAESARGRQKLAEFLHACAAHIADAARETETAWRILEPLIQTVTEPLAKRSPILNARTDANYELVPASAENTSNADIPTIVSICNEPPIYNLLFAARSGGNPYSQADAERFLAWGARGWREGTHFLFLIRSDSGEVAGAMDIKSPNLESAEIGYWLSAHHSGVMTNAVCALVRLARNAGYAELFALVRPTNTRSANVVARAGFTQGETITRNETVYHRWVIRLLDQGT